MHEVSQEAGAGAGVHAGLPAGSVQEVSGLAGAQGIQGSQVVRGRARVPAPALWSR